MKKKHSAVVFAVGWLFACLGHLLCSYPASAADLTVAWTANSESDLTMYKIYLRKGSEGPPYELIGSVGLQEIDPGNPAAVVTGLEDNTVYYLTVTAIDTEGYESAYSISACAEVAGGIVQACAVEDGGTAGGVSGTSSSDGGGGGGGGGGCFLYVLSE